MIRGAICLVLLGTGCALALGSAAASLPETPADVLTLRPNDAHGERLFAMCSICHGSEGHGSTSLAVPGIAGQHYAVLVAQLLEFRNGLRPDALMQRAVDPHHLEHEQDLTDTADYISRLPRLAVAARDQTSSSAAAGIYERQCARCHGDAGQGSASRLVPVLAGQSAQYLARQLHLAQLGRRPALATQHASLLSEWDETQRRSVAEFIASLGHSHMAAPTE